MEAKLVMSRSVVTAQRKNSVKDVLAKMIKAGTSCAIVVEKKTPVGIFTNHDLFQLIDSDSDLSTTIMETAMNPNVVCIHETQNFFNSVRLHGKQDVWRFPVLDSENRVKGMATEKEITEKYALRSFPHNMMLASLKSPGITATPTTSIRKVLNLVVQARLGCVVILKGRKPVGVIDEFSLAKLTSKDALKVGVGLKMSKKFMAAKAGSSVREAVIKMIKMGREEIVVTDDNGNYYGVVTQHELVTHIEKTQL